MELKVQKLHKFDFNDLETIMNPRLNLARIIEVIAYTNLVWYMFWNGAVTFNKTVYDSSNFRTY